MRCDGKPRVAAGAALMIASALFFSAMQIAVRLSGAGGDIPLMEQVFFRNLFSLIVVLPVLLRKRVPPFGSRRDQPLLFGRSIAGFLGIVTYFYATNHARVADASILNRLSPVVVTLLSAAFLHEKIGIVQLLSLAVSFLGTWIVCGPAMDSAFLPIVSALLSALFSGTAYTFVSALRTRTDPLAVIMHFSAFSVVTAFVCMLPDFVMPDVGQLIALLLIGCFGSLGQICLTYAYRFAPAAEVSIYNYFGIIWAALLGYAFLGESVGTATAVGGALIIAASLINFLHAKRGEKKALAGMNSAGGKELL